MLQVQFILYIYMMVCVALLLFHIAYIFYDMLSKKRNAKIEEAYYMQIKKQLPVYIRHIHVIGIEKEKLLKSLLKMRNLIAYHHVVEKLLQEQPTRMRAYLNDHHLVYQKLAVHYRKKDSMQRAYLAFLMKVFLQGQDRSHDELLAVLLSYLDDASVYCRENVLQAFYELGNVNVIESAFQYLQDHKIFHHNKLLSDGLIHYHGDKQELALRLWLHRNEWDENMMLAIINFIRFAKVDYREEFYQCLLHEEGTQEEQLALIRYFCSIPYEKTKMWLCEKLKERETCANVFAVVACSTLASYPCAQVREILKKMLTDNNWYVRKNAAASYLSMHPSKQDIDSIMHGKDPYAKEMLDYQMQMLKKGEDV